MPDATFDVSRAAAVVTHKWRELVHVRYNEDSRNVQTHWKDHAITDTGARPLAMRDEYERLVAAAPKPQRRSRRRRTTQQRGAKRRTSADHARSDDSRQPILCRSGRRLKVFDDRRGQRVDDDRARRHDWGRSRTMQRQ